MVFDVDMEFDPIPEEILGIVPGRIMERESLRAIEEAAVLTRNTMNLATPFGGTGLTSESWQLINAHEERPRRFVGGAVTSNVAAIVLEKGARYSGIRRPPPSRLSTWVRRKLGITEEAAVKSATEAISRAIAKRGLPAPGREKGIFSKAFRELELPITQIMERAAARIARAIAGS